MSVISLNESKLKDFQQEAHPEREILEATTPASPEVTGGACVIPKAAWAEFQEADHRKGPGWNKQ